MRNRKTDIAAAALVIMAAATCVSLITHRNSPANDETDETPSFLHTTLEGEIMEETDNVYEQIDTYSTNLNTSSVYDSAEVEKGSYVTFAKGSVFIVDDGSMSAVCDDHLINVTKGISVGNGEDLEEYDLYVVTGEEDSIYALEDSEIFVKGGYKITENIKE